MEFGRDISKLRKARLFTGTQYGKIATFLIGIQLIASGIFTYLVVKPGNGRRSDLPELISLQVGGNQLEEYFRKKKEANQKKVLESLEKQSKKYGQ